MGRMLWALSDKSGLPAKRFADLNPSPPLEWLEAFSEERYTHTDLHRFGVTPHAKVDSKLRFSLVRRPAPYQLAPWMTVVTSSFSSAQWDKVMSHLAHWLMRYINDPTLLIWFAQRGGQLYKDWLWLIEHELDRFSRLEAEGKTAELSAIRKDSPMAIPSPQMQTLWRLLLNGRVQSTQHDPDLYRWSKRLKRDGLTTSMRLELRELLAPKITLKKSFHWGNEETIPDETARIRKLVDWELVLNANHVHSTISDRTGTYWQEALPELLDELQQLLRDALDLLHELGEADERDDRSHWDLPSITPHWQNRGFHDWVTLIELLRDAWLAVNKSDPKRAHSIALRWFEMPYPTFKRLALFAASQNVHIASDQWVEWLISDNAWWLWSINSKRETMRLLVLQGTQLSTLAQEKLETTILAGPPRNMYKNDIESDYWKSLVDRLIWLYLAKLQESGVQLAESASRHLESLSEENPEWRLATNEQDEFSHWMSGTGDPDYEENRNVDIAPRKRAALVEWLKRPPPERQSFYEDTWRETCRTRFFHSFLALCDLAKEELWPDERWRIALQAWSEEGHILRAWHYAAPLVQNMPDATMKEIVHSVAWWMSAASKTIDCHESILLKICRRVLAFELDVNTDIRQNGKLIDEHVTDAINHPVGLVTQALLNLWFKREPEDHDSLPKDIKPFFTQLCNVNIDKFRHGRVLLASRLIALFRVDTTWTEKYLLPLFYWESNTIEAKAVWEGFLWSPRLFQPLMIALRPSFLSTAQHYQELGEHGRQYVMFLTYVALDRIDNYTTADFQTAIGALPIEGLEAIAQALSQALEGAAEQRQDYWKNRVLPFWQHIWPKSLNLVTDRIVESLSRLSIAAGSEFPQALAAVLDWLQPIEHPDYTIHRLYESGLCIQFPVTALQLLNKLIAHQQWAPRELAQCLELIANSSPDLRQDLHYQRLETYSRQHGD